MLVTASAVLIFGLDNCTGFTGFNLAFSLDFDILEHTWRQLHFLGDVRVRKKKPQLIHKASRPRRLKVRFLLGWMKKGITSRDVRQGSMCSFKNWTLCGSHDVMTKAISVSEQKSGVGPVLNPGRRLPKQDTTFVKLQDRRDGGRGGGGTARQGAED